MKVRGIESGITSDPRVASAKKATGEQNATSGKGEAAKVTLSASASSLRGVREDLDKIPEIRADKVNPIIDEIKSGNYNRPPDKIAEKMLASHLIESSYGN